MPKISSSPSVTKEVQGLLRQFRLENVPSHLLRRAHFKAEEIFANTFSEEDVTPRQKAALVLLHTLEGDLDNARYWYRRTTREFPGPAAVQREIAAALGISLSAVEKHLQRAYRALAAIADQPEDETHSSRRRAP